MLSYQMWRNTCKFKIWLFVCIFIYSILCRTKVSLAQDLNVHNTIAAGTFDIDKCQIALQIIILSDLKYCVIIFHKYILHILPNHTNELTYNDRWSYVCDMTVFSGTSLIIRQNTRLRMRNVICQIFWIRTNELQTNYTNHTLEYITINHWKIRI